MTPAAGAGVENVVAGVLRDAARRWRDTNQGWLMSPAMFADWLDEEAARFSYQVPLLPHDAEYVRSGVCLLCGDGVLSSGEHLDIERHRAAVERIVAGSG